MTPLLSVKNLHASIQEKEILRGVDLNINPGEVHFLMGPNGSGKSTFGNALMGHPAIAVTDGAIHFKGEEITRVLPDERARRGLYLGFQYPAEVGGVPMSMFLRSVRAARGTPFKADTDFAIEFAPAAASLKLPEAFFLRNVNEGFSGGEKKRSEIFQLQVLSPALAILDEFDSGLDVDGLKAVFAALKEYMTPQRALLIITHYGRLTEYLKPDVVHVMMSGKIVAQGGEEIITHVEEKGFGEFVSVS